MAKSYRFRLSPDEYHRLQKIQRFLDSVAVGLADVKAGRVMTTEELRKRLLVHRSRSRNLSAQK